MNFLLVKTRQAKSYSRRQIEICFVNLFDARVFYCYYSLIIAVSKYFPVRTRAGYKSSLSHGKLVGMTRQSDSSIVFRWKKTDQERLPFEWNFRWIFLDKWNCTFFPLRKRNRLNRIIWSEFSNASEPGSGHMSCQQETWRLNFLVLDVLSDDLEIVFFFLEKATISSFKLLQQIAPRNVTGV